MNGKFKCEKIGKRFLMAIGSDRNLHESILTRRSYFMKEIIKLYHNDIEQICEQDPKKLNDKLFQIFETYLPVIQNNSNVLQSVYKLQLPKSASNLYLTAVQILENIANRHGVLGGLIMYNSKVVCSQFSTSLTKVLAGTDPNRIKTTADTSKNDNFYIPTGSQIIKIFITLNEYKRLQTRNKKVIDATSLGGTQNVLTLPFSIKKKPKETRRDKLIFSHIPEEEPLVVEVVKSKRPNHLPLKLKTVAPESGIVSFDETDSYPDFIGRTTVAQTPLMAITPMVGPISSIFASNEDPAEIKIKKISKKIEPKEWKPIFISYAANPFKAVDFKKSCDDIFRPLKLKDSSYNVYNTITDPFYPIISAENKRPISKSLFDEYQALFLPPQSLTPDEPIAKTVQNEPKKKFENDPMIIDRVKVNDNKNSPSRIQRNQKKKMLKLPIKSFSLEIDSGKPSTSTGSNNIFDSPSTKRKLGLQLTPLMSKLTLLAMNENENLSSTLEPQTPNYYYADTPVDNCNRNMFNRLAKVDEEKHEIPNEDISTDEMKRVDLFVHGEKNLTLMIIADENVFDKEMVQQMFDVCVNRLSRLEQRLNDLINVTYDLKANDYSFVTIDKNWDVLQRSGNYDLQSTTLMHDKFDENRKLTDIILRTNDAIIYGHNNVGRTEAFYQHPAKLQPGLPAPSEFTIISSAKRKLERDQSLVLF